jgi:hypothetical protein
MKDTNLKNILLFIRKQKLVLFNISDKNFLEKKWEVQQVTTNGIET